MCFTEPQKNQKKLSAALPQTQTHLITLPRLHNRRRPCPSPDHNPLACQNGRTLSIFSASRRLCTWEFWARSGHQKINILCNCTEKNYF